MSEENINNILKDFLNSAGKGEIEELESLLEKRKRSAKIDVNAIASNMARNLHDSMGINSDSVKASARNLVKTMILQNDPFIPEHELDQLIEMMLSDGSAEKPDIPADMLMEMILHFVKYSFNEMSEQELNDLPEGWTERYWDAFPVEVQKIIRELINSNISRAEFWGMVEAVIKKL